MQRLLRDITAGIQTLRFLTALVCSATVTTAVAMPMAIKAMNYEPPVALGPAQSSQEVDGPPAAVALPPTTVSQTQPSTSVAGASAALAPAPPATAAAPAAPGATLAPVAASTTAAAPTVGVSNEQLVAQEPAPTTAVTTPGPTPATTTAPPTSTTAAAPPTTSFDDVFDVIERCGPNAHELNQDRPGVCDPNAASGR